MAAGDISQKFGTHTHATITLTSLASSATAGRESTAIDVETLIGSGPVLDVLCQVKVKLASGTIANEKCVYVYVGCSEDGAKYPDPMTGSDAACNSSNNLTLAAVIDTPTQSTSYISKAFSIAALCGGVLPRKFGVVVRNYSGIALTGTAGDHEVTFSPVYAAVAQS